MDILLKNSKESYLTNIFQSKSVIITIIEALQKGSLLQRFLNQTPLGKGTGVFRYNDMIQRPHVNQIQGLFDLVCHLLVGVVRFFYARRVIVAEDTSKK